MPFLLSTYGFLVESKLKSSFESFFGNEASLEGNEFFVDSSEWSWFFISSYFLISSLAFLIVLSGSIFNYVFGFIVWSA